MKLSIKSALLVSAAFGFSLPTVFLVLPANAEIFSFNTGVVTNFMAAATQPESAGKFEIESADDFVTTGTQTSITSATFTGLLPSGLTAADIGAVTVEIYRVFPKDSDVGRTSGPPTFSTSAVPTRVNSPSDVALASRSTTTGDLGFSMSVLSPTFTVLNSVQPGGIHPKPGQTTGGDGAFTGQEVKFNVIFTTPFNLSADHYFFVPQVEVTTLGSEFLWLSGTRPNPLFPTGFADLQSWTRDHFLDPDWLRIGTDIVGGSPAPTFNAAFTLAGVESPLPAALPLFATGLAGLGLLRWRRKKKTAASA